MPARLVTHAQSEMRLSCQPVAVSSAECSSPPQIVPWFSFSVPGAMHLMMLTVTAGAAFGCYVAAVVTDPGACASACAPAGFTRSL